MTLLDAILLGLYMGLGGVSGWQLRGSYAQQQITEAFNNGFDCGYQSRKHETLQGRGER